MVRSGSEALREVLNREFAVILLDVNMPDIDGLETGRLIRQYKRSALTPIIFITAYADEMQTAQGYSLGAVDYILSPVRPDVLRSKVKVFVDLYKMQQRTKAMAEADAARLAAEENTSRATRRPPPRHGPRARLHYGRGRGGRRAPGGRPGGAGGGVGGERARGGQALPARSKLFNVPSGRPQPYSPVMC